MLVKVINVGNKTAYNPFVSFLTYTVKLGTICHTHARTSMMGRSHVTPLAVRYGSEANGSWRQRQREIVIVMLLFCYGL
jgi:hypothetical protein